MFNARGERTGIARSLGNPARDPRRERTRIAPTSNELRASARPPYRRSGRLWSLLLTVAVAGAATPDAALLIELRGLFAPRGTWQLRLRRAVTLIVLLRQALLAARLLEPTFLALLLFPAAIVLVRHGVDPVRGGVDRSSHKTFASASDHSRGCRPKVILAARGAMLTYDPPKSLLPRRLLPGMLRSSRVRLRSAILRAAVQH